MHPPATIALRMPRRLAEGVQKGDGGEEGGKENKEERNIKDRMKRFNGGAGDGRGGLEVGPDHVCHRRGAWVVNRLCVKTWCKAKEKQECDLLR